MIDRDKYMQDSNSRGYDKNRGFNADSLENAMTKANADCDKWPRLPGSSDDIDSDLAQDNSWKEPVLTEEDKAIYMGLHIHNDPTNPLGLHTHVKGGKLSGGHVHSPLNRFGSHHHREIDTTKTYTNKMYSLDGNHSHEYQNAPSGGHEHHPSNFG